MEQPERPAHHHRDLHGRIVGLALEQGMILLARRFSYA